MCGRACHCIHLAHLHEWDFSIPPLPHLVSIHTLTFSNILLVFALNLIVNKSSYCKCSLAWCQARTFLLFAIWTHPLKMREYPLQYASTDKNKKSHYNCDSLIGYTSCTAFTILTPYYLRLSDWSEMMTWIQFRCQLSIKVGGKLHCRQSWLLQHTRTESKFAVWQVYLWLLKEKETLWTIDKHTLAAHSSFCSHHNSVWTKPRQQHKTDYHNNERYVQNLKLNQKFQNNIIKMTRYPSACSIMVSVYVIKFDFHVIFLSQMVFAAY